MNERMRNQPAYALRVNDVGKHYRRTKDEAEGHSFSLNDVTFDLPMGYIMGLIGPNGAGKSTLIRLILNMITRDRGTIEILGMDNIAHEESVKAQLGVVFDTSYFVNLWTVDTCGKAMAPLYPTWQEDAFRQYLERFGLAPKKKVKDLSRGMQMKLMLAVALSHDARLLVLDEPTAGLDVLARDELMDLLADYIADGQHSVLFSSHITSDLERVADFITYINGGSLCYTGPRDEFEDAFVLIHGAPGDLTTAQRRLAVGVREFATGFDALVAAENAQAFLTAEGGRHAVAGPDASRYSQERPEFDDIMRLTSERVSDGNSKGIREQLPEDERQEVRL
ncbi:ATP-binding protein of ABC transporter system [Bifidobacterium actinocoloniiforme DSM 22766]|uniref:ATP-binding protein of ABC transporter system n=1 Tax=Bifidobacterium actinocoloniiforme DSM 22766 TaxID=1437605 RepID=A0A086Z0N5_9BIFI|nr:ABC transporter ATP-binding protein [Bifidobacterium actinocoloniiforme]KFI40085.1 ATP-binding protein of ABC transporter system [Bifidobacterium actinocoloniiforme DSM 22766]